MRFAILAAALIVAACGQSSIDGTAGSTAVGDVPEEAFTLESEALVGIWSFDRSCASGDGMSLRADGTASYDEWGEGTWVTQDNNRVVLTLAVTELGVGPTGETTIYNLDVAAPVTDDLIGNLARPDGTEPRGVNALRCPENM